MKKCYKLCTNQGPPVIQMCIGYECNSNSFYSNQKCDFCIRKERERKKCRILLVTILIKVSTNGGGYSMSCIKLIENL